jgi:hypothetical protein
VSTIKKILQEGMEKAKGSTIPKVSEGTRLKVIEWVFCCVCNKSMRKQERVRDQVEYHHIQIGFNEEYCSWDQGSSGKICVECFPSVRSQLYSILPYLFKEKE